MATQSNFPAIRPTLNLDFANSKTVDPRITFSRASAATFYDGKTTAKAEENLLLYSQAMASGNWTQSLSFLTNNVVAAPDGTVTAVKEAGKSSAGYHGTNQAVSVLASTNYTVSIYAKAAEYSSVYIANGSTNNFRISFDLVAGTVSSTQGSVVSSSITSVGNGWYRLVATFTTTGSATAVGLSIGGYPDSAILDVYGAQYTGDGTSGVYIWGAQLEQRSSVTAYTPTTTQPITNYIPVLQTAAAGVPRIDHDPITGECKGLLIEEQRTNLLTYSEQFNSAAWTKSTATIQANVVVAPDGALTADKLVGNSGATGSSVNTPSITTTASSTYTLSAYVKAGGCITVQLVATGNTGTNPARAWFNIATGVAGTNNGGFSLIGISPSGDGWYRVFATFTASGTSSVCYIVNASADNVNAYNGDGYSGIYIWGAQLEAGAFPTSYIKTEASQVTRSADAASMTGTNFSSWYRQDEWTLFADAESSATGGTSSQAGGLFNIYGIGSDRISAFVGAAGSVRYESVVGGAVPFGLNNGLVSPNVFYRLTAGYKVNDFALASNNNSAVATDNSGSVMQNAIGLQFGSVFATGQLNGHIKKLAYYPKRLSNSELQALTA